MTIATENKLSAQEREELRLLRAIERAGGALPLRTVQRGGESRSVRQGFGIPEGNSPAHEIARGLSAQGYRTNDAEDSLRYEALQEAGYCKLAMSTVVSAGARSETAVVRFTDAGILRLRALEARS